MSLIFRRPWTTQPPTRPRINWGHPITQGLKGLVWVGPGVNPKSVDLINPQLPTEQFEGTASGTTKGTGRSVTGSQVGYYSGFSGVQPLVAPWKIASTPVTLLALMDVAPSGAGSKIYAGVASGADGVQIRNAYGGLYRGARISGTLLDPVTLWDTGVHIKGVVHDGATMSIVDSGRFLNSTADTTTTITYDAAFTGVTFMESTSGGTGLWMGIWNRALSQGETLALERNPWLLFQPQPRFRVASASGGGAISGTAAVTFTPTGTITGAGALAGSAALVFGGTGALTGNGQLAGTADLTFTAAGAVAGAGALAGAAALAFGATGTLTGASAGEIAGSAAMAFGATGTLAGSGALAGMASMTFDGLLTTPEAADGGSVRRPAAGPAWHARIGDKIVRGSRQQIEALLRQLAQEHAEEDEARIEQDEPPKKRAVRVVAPGKVNVQPAKQPSVTVALPLMESAGITQTQAADVYARAYEQHMRRQEIKDDDDDVQSVVEHVRKHRASLGAALAKHIEALKDLL